MSADLHPGVETQEAFARLSPRQVVLHTQAAVCQAQGDSGSMAGRHQEDHQVEGEGDTSRVASGVGVADVDGDGGVDVHEVGGRGGVVCEEGWGVQEVDVDYGAHAYQIHEKIHKKADCIDLS